MMEAGRKLLWVLVVCFSTLSAHSGKLDKAYNSLRQFDYFSAKAGFEKQLRKHMVPAAYGLSVIYERQDNPFHQTDSALKYVLLADSAFHTLDAKQKAKVFVYGIDSAEILAHKKRISSHFFKKAFLAGTADAMNGFLAMHFWFEDYDKAIQLRDSIAFAEALRDNNWQAFETFFQKYPDAKQVPQARAKYDLLFFKNTVKSGRIEDFQRFVRDYPMSPYNEDAQDQVYLLSTRSGTLESYHDFISQYPDNRNVEHAWKALYMKSVHTNSPLEIEAFIQKFPDYPFKDDALLDYALANTPFYTYRNGENWGFIDDSGRVTIPASYEWVEDFHNGAAAVGLHEKSGFINKRGDVIVPIVYDDVMPFNQGIAVVSRNEKYGLVSTHGHLIVGLHYDDLGPMSDGMIRILKNGFYGFLNMRYQEIIPPRFESAGDFNRGLAVVVQDGRYGVINKKGEWLIKPEYAMIIPAAERVFVAQADSGYRLMDTSGKCITSGWYQFIGPFSEQHAIAVVGQKYGIINTYGREVLSPQFKFDESVISLAVCRGGKIRLRNDKGMVGMIDTNGKKILPFIYDDIGGFDSLRMAVRKNSKWGYINLDQRVMIKMTYDYASDFEAGLARVKRKDKWGMINRAGLEVFPLKYGEIQWMDGNHFRVMMDGKIGIMNHNHQCVLPADYDKIEFVRANMYRLWKDEKQAYYNLKMNKILFAETGFETE